jgi:hypothetical protein
MPGSVELAHLRNPRPDIAAARAVGEAACNGMGSKGRKFVVDVR